MKNVYPSGESSRCVGLKKEFDRMPATEFATSSPPPAPPFFFLRCLIMKEHGRSCDRSSKVSAVSTQLLQCGIMWYCVHCSHHTQHRSILYIESVLAIGKDAGMSLAELRQR
jgi:hypothetical protein